MKKEAWIPRDIEIDTLKLPFDKNFDALISADIEKYFNEEVEEAGIGSTYVRLLCSEADLLSREMVRESVEECLRKGEGGVCNCVVVGYE
jgi:hypothetical protein